MAGLNKSLSGLANKGKSAGKAVPEVVEEAPAPPPKDDGRTRVRKEAKLVFERVFGEWKELGKIDVAALRGIVEEFVLLVPGDPKTTPPDLRVTGAYEIAHPINVLGYSLQVGKAMGIGGETLRHLGLAALLHDFGKDVPENHPDSDRLKKADDHCGTGFKLLGDLAPTLPKPVLEAIRDHHERVDGGGVQKKTKFSEIAAIVALIDTYDARITPHWFRGAMSPHVAYTLTLNTGSRFPKEVVDAFAESIVPYPLGTPVFLIDGRRGEVLEVDPENSTTPIVLIAGEREDLRDDPNNRIADIVRSPLPV